MKVIVYPISNNPYQNLLYSRIDKNISIKFLRNKFIDERHAFILGIPLFPFRFLYLKLAGWKVLHLHWLLPFVLPYDNILFRIISTLYIISFLFWIKILRFKLVWTVHEIYPHKQEFINDLFIRKLVSKMSDATIYHTQSSLEEAQLLGFSMKKTFIIPIGNYISSYKNTLTKSTAREKLNLDTKDFVFVFFGLIKPYKGIDDLLFNFGTLINMNSKKRIKLVIAGPSEDEHSLEVISKYKKKYKGRIQTYIEYIEDINVQIFLHCADVVALPYKRNTTSAAALLAFGFKKPIIAPLLGSFKEFPMDTGFYYKDNKLLEAMQQAITNKAKLQKMGKRGYAIAKKISWENIADLTSSVYGKL
jgi:beta-1,4-mannosyltransferase